MAGFIFLIAFVALGILASYCSGQCGFPGQPKHGRVLLPLEPHSLNEIRSENSSLSAVYSCDGNHLLVPSVNRQCAEGKWEGETPQCLKIERIHKIFEDNTRGEKDLKGCLYINSGYTYLFQIEKERRLHSIRLKTKFSYWNSFQNANFTFQGSKNDSFEWEKLNVGVRTNSEYVLSSSLVLTNYSNSCHFKNIRLTSNIGVYICEIILFAYHDECGYPEVPLHGHVNFEPGDTQAIYRCDDGYKLDSKNPIRHCIQGRWNGSQPICESLTAKTTRRESFHKRETYILIVICSGLIVIVAILLVILYKKTRLSCSGKSRRTEDDANYYASLEESQRVADTAHQVDSRYIEQEANFLDVAEESESAEQIRLNRQSRREWMEHHSHHYAELSDFADGSAPSRPEEQPQLLYANFQEASQEGPIYAQVDKSKKTNRK